MLLSPSEAVAVFRNREVEKQVSQLRPREEEQRLESAAAVWLSTAASILIGQATRAKCRLLGLQSDGQADGLFFFPCACNFVECHLLPDVNDTWKIHGAKGYMHIVTGLTR